MGESRSRQRTCQTSPSPPHRVSTEAPHFHPSSAHLPGEANWVRQMEQRHEIRLIPFEDFDGKRNLWQFRISLAYCLKYLQFAVLVFFLFWRFSQQSQCNFPSFNLILLNTQWLNCSKPWFSCIAYADYFLNAQVFLLYRQCCFYRIATLPFLVFFEMFSRQINWIYVAHKFASKGFKSAQHTTSSIYLLRWGKREKSQLKQHGSISEAGQTCNRFYVHRVDRNKLFGR